MNRDKKEAVQRASQNAHDEGIKEGIRKFKEREQKIRDENDRLRQELRSQSSGKPKIGFHSSKNITVAPMTNISTIPVIPKVTIPMTVPP